MLENQPPTIIQQQGDFIITVERAVDDGVTHPTDVFAVCAGLKFNNLAYGSINLNHGFPDRGNVFVEQPKGVMRIELNVNYLSAGTLLRLVVPLPLQ